MAEIDGVYEGAHVGRALARAKYKKARSAAAGAQGAGAGSPAADRPSGATVDEGDTVGKLAEIHPEAQEAVKSSHVYEHADGRAHVHTHNHENGEHEHREHDNAKSAAEHVREFHGAGPGMEEA